MLYSKLLVIGDSLSGPSRAKTTWVTQACEYAKRRYYSHLLPVVYGYSGSSSFEIAMDAGRILEGYRARIKEVIFQFGTNDAKDEVQTPPEIFYSYVELMKEWSFGYRAYFLTIPPHAGFGTDGYTASIKPRIYEYNRIIKEVFADHAIDLSAVNHVTDYADGIHYTDQGNAKVAQIVVDRLFTERTFK